MGLEPGAERLLRMLAAAGGARRSRTVGERRRMLAALAQSADEGAPAAVETCELVLPGPGGRLLFGCLGHTRRSFDRIYGQYVGDDGRPQADSAKPRMERLPL